MISLIESIGKEFYENKILTVLTTIGATVVMILAVYLVHVGVKYYRLEHSDYNYKISSSDWIYYCNHVEGDSSKMVLSDCNSGDGYIMYNPKVVVEKLNK